MPTNKQNEALETLTPQAGGQVPHTATDRYGRPLVVLSGSCTSLQNLDVDESQDAIKTTAGQLYFVHAINLTASMLFLKFYDATVATVVVGTTVPVLTFPIPTQGDTNGAGFVLSTPVGIAFNTAITVAATTGLAVADTGAPATNALIVNVGYV